MTGATIATRLTASSLNDNPSLIRQSFWTCDGDAMIASYARPRALTGWSVPDAVGCWSSRPASEAGSATAQTFIGSSRPRIDTSVRFSPSGVILVFVQTSTETTTVQFSTLVMS